MQLSGDAALDAAVNATVRTVVYQAEFDWNLDGNFSHDLSDLTKLVSVAQVLRDITKVLPVETTIVEGFYASRLTLRLAGRRKGDALDIAQILSPLKQSSPLYGRERLGVPVRFKLGHKVQSGVDTLAQQFQGRIVDCQVVSGSREVVIQCQDDSEYMRAPITLPDFALQVGLHNQVDQDQIYRVNSQWTIDYILRRNGYFMSPPPQLNCFWMMTGHGGPVPERGFQTYLQSSAGRCAEDEPVYFPGRPGWGLAYGGCRTGTFTISSRTWPSGFTFQPGQSVSLQAQVLVERGSQAFSTIGTILLLRSNVGTPAGAVIGMRVNPNNGQLICDVYKDGATVATVFGPILGTVGVLDCWIIVELGSPLSASVVRFPGMNVNVNLSGLASPAVSTYYQVQFTGMLPAHDIQICAATGLPPGDTLYDPTIWVPQSEVDTGLNDVTGLPLRRGVGSWDLLKEVVGAEYGVIGLNEYGRPFFKNRDTMRRQNLTEEKAISRRLNSQFGLSEREGSVRNWVTAKTAIRRLPHGVGGLTGNPVGGTNVYDLDDPSKILLAPGNNIIELTIEPGAIIDVVTVPEIITTANWNANNWAYGFAVTRVSDGLEGTGVTCTGILPLRPEAAGPDKIRITFLNNTFQYMRFQTTDGRPALRLAGAVPYDEPPTDFSHYRLNSLVRYGEQVLALPPSDWYQLQTPLQRIAHSLLKDLQRPVPVIDQITTRGDCRVQLEDTLLVEDEDALADANYAAVVGLSRELSVAQDTGLASLIDKYNVRPLGAPGQWILGHPVWGVLGQTTKT
jgi:hypothetical protein